MFGTETSSMIPSVSSAAAVVVVTGFDCGLVLCVVAGAGADAGPVSCGGLCGFGSVGPASPPSCFQPTTSNSGRCFIPTKVFIGRRLSFTAGTTLLPRSARMVMTFSRR